MQKIKNLLLTTMRDITTPVDLFRRTTDKLTEVLVTETITLLETEPHPITTPITQMNGTKCTEKVLLIPILRAGLAMMPMFQKYFEMASIGILGYKRDKTTCKACMYYDNVPTVEAGTKVIILDPMLATGNTVCSAIKFLNNRGVKDRQIIYTGILGAPEGKNKLENMHPEIKIVLGALDEKLNDVKFIVPGIGDFGDRYFGTL